MTITDIHLSKLEQRQTSSVVAVLISGALLASGQSVELEKNIVPDQLYTPGSVESSYSAFELEVDKEITTEELVSELVKLHDMLLQSQTALDAEAEKILGNNLWEMYV